MPFMLRKFLSILSFPGAYIRNEYWILWSVFSASTKLIKWFILLFLSCYFVNMANDTIDFQMLYQPCIHQINST